MRVIVSCVCVFVLRPTAFVRDEGVVVIYDQLLP